MNSSPIHYFLMFLSSGMLATLSHPFLKENISLKKPSQMLTTRIPVSIVNHKRRDGSINELTEPVSMYNKHMRGLDLLEQQVDYSMQEKDLSITLNLKNIIFQLSKGWLTILNVLYDNNIVLPLKRYSILNSTQLRNFVQQYYMISCLQKFHMCTGVGYF